MASAAVVALVVVVVGDVVVAPNCAGPSPGSNVFVGSCGLDASIVASSEPPGGVGARSRSTPMLGDVVLDVAAFAESTSMAETLSEFATGLVRGGLFSLGLFVVVPLEGRRRERVEADGDESSGGVSC